MKNKTIIFIVIAVLVGALGFFGGREYQKTKTPSFQGFGNRQSLGQRNQNGQSQRDFSGRVLGEILSLDDNSITVSMPDGSSKIIILSDQTKFNKLEAGSKDELKTGDQVGVFGVANPDGSITAQDVQINPVSRNLQGGNSEDQQ